MKELQTLIDESQRIVIIQADNPDGDSVASALALEQILSEIGKEPLLYCGVDIPGYLKYMVGWDRISTELRKQFDLSIIVDTSSLMLLEMLDKNGELGWIKAKPSIIIDHHATESTIDFATAAHLQPAVSTTELIYELAQKHKWPLNNQACEFIAIGILSDSLGLVSEATSARSIHIVGELVDQGVELAKIDNMRRQLQKKQPEILRYKGKLLERVEYSEDGRVAFIVIPWEEIEKYSHLYNPSMLVLDEMRHVEGVAVAMAFKTYPDGRITGKIRANYGFQVADKLAEHFGGGGHPYAGGFRITDGRGLDVIRDEAIKKASELLDNIEA